MLAAHVCFFFICVSCPGSEKLQEGMASREGTGSREKINESFFEQPFSSQHQQRISDPGCPPAPPKPWSHSEVMHCSAGVSRSVPRRGGKSKSTGASKGL